MQTLAIRDVIDRYAIGLDRRDWELVRTCFTADCVADYGRTGRWTDRETLIDALDEIHRDIGPTLHRLSNHYIEVDGDAARATTYLDAVLKVEHPDFDLVHVIGTYHDELTRGSDEWLISSRRVDTFMFRRESTSSRR